MIVDNLNEKQKEVVIAPPGNYLILAGAGSGKTRVLVHRMAWLISHYGLSPYGILAVTFTNKAAHEMRHRLEKLLTISGHGLWVGTFHGLAHRLLRMHWREARLSENFQILDSDDQQQLIKRLLKQMDLDEKQWVPRQCQWYINSHKEQAIRSSKITATQNVYEKTMQRIYATYETTCQQNHLVDFSEILLRSYEIWLEYPDLLRHYQERLQQILVDEFQDTNTIQYAWLRLLVGQQGFITAVGDDDQSIYGWRGACVRNIQHFSQDFPNTRLIRLEQNYRSTGNILAAANALIDNNADRLGKTLWTAGPEGELIKIYPAFNELDEAKFIISTIRSYLENGFARREMAILYRSNAQSRVLEEYLLHAGISYRVYGGLRFFDRAEIKDALAYLRLILLHSDDGAFERIINTPPRGIGAKTIEAIRERARREQLPLWQAMIGLLEEQSLSGRAHQSLMNFKNLISDLSEDITNVSLADLTEAALMRCGLWDYHTQSRSERAQTRKENLQELLTACRQFSPDPDSTLPPLATFLSHVALESTENQAEEHQDAIQLMTLHSAKGLEFPIVFIAGLEEGLFPHQLSLKEPGQLTEERRLCYVGMTRAKEKLYLSYAETRYLHGVQEYHRPSRFLNEIPEHLLQMIRPVMHTKSVRRDSFSSTPNYKMANNSQQHESGIRLGQSVQHPKFGEGVVLNIEGQGEHTRLQVQFKQAGTKWLVLAYANLTVE